MRASSEFWSIGEVLSLLQDEFPEITISKIRFLESQGLISPERTPSGYRRFYDRDFDLLRWILVQQRDHYLPLKVIRDRIAAGDTEIESVDRAAAEQTLDPVASPAEPDATHVAEPAVAASPAHATADARPSVEATAPEPAAGGAASEARAVEPVGGHVDTEAVEPDAADTDIDSADDDEPSEPTVVGAVERGAPTALTRDELAAASGCSVKTVADLERYGLVKGRKAGPTVLYDGTALTITRIASQFANFGLDARHLRTFLIGAEREVGLIHQVVEPMLLRRDDETRRKALETLDDLTDLAGSLRAILVHQAIDELVPRF